MTGKPLLWEISIGGKYKIILENLYYSDNPSENILSPKNSSTIKIADDEPW